MSVKVSMEVSWAAKMGGKYPGAAFSWSVALDLLLLFLEALLKICTSNCHLSTCSPVSLLVITMTSFEILLPTIHLSS